MMQDAVALRPLQCVGCGAALPLGQAKTARCRFCNAETPIPDAYLALQRSAKSFADNRTLAEQLYGDVGQPPGRFLRTWGQGAEGTARIGALVVGGLLAAVYIHPLVGLGCTLAAAYALGYPVAAAWHGVDWILGYPSVPLSPYPVLLIAALVVVLLVGIPAVLFGKERALAKVRKDIHASLAAAPPERPGGPSRCRTCGAALDIPQGALGVPCVYCNTDNLVALPETWVTRLQASEFHHFLQIDAALDAFRRTAREANEELWLLLAGLVFSLPVIMLLAYVLDAAGFLY